jgi:predicted ferric reductase
LLPVIVALLVGLPVGWAFPEGVRLWRASAIVFGWAGSGLLLASLLLMVREVRLAHWLGGLERMTRWHHRSGLAAYLLLLLHPLALAADGWVESPPLAWQGISPFSASWPVWLGWGALLLLMLGLATTFARHLPYRLWRALHGLLGVAVIIGFVHVLLLGINLGALLAILTAALLLAWRLLRVDAGLAARPYIVRSVAAVAPSMVEISLAPLATPIAARAGQFVLVAFFHGPHYRGCGEYHPFTVSALGPGGQFGIGAKALGDCTQQMQTLEPGVAARVHGPFGDFLADRPASPQFWVAGGIGITPFLATLRSAPLTQATRLLYLFRSPTEAAFLAELQALAETDAHFSLDARATGAGLPDLEQLLPSSDTLRGQACYLCGPPGLIDSIVRGLTARGVEARAIHFERFDFR